MSENTEDTNVATIREMTPDDARAIRNIIDSKFRLKSQQVQVRDDVKAVADRLGIKTKDLNAIIKRAIEEQSKGNVIAWERQLLDLAEKVVTA